MNETTSTSTESDDESTATDDESTANAPLADLESGSGPDSLRHRDDVPFVEATNVHDDADHCSVGIEGRAVVGVTNDDGEVLLMVNEEIPVAILPNETVEPGDDWTAAARRAVEGVTDLSVDLDGLELVRDVDHFVEEAHDDEPHATSSNVVFRASPADGAETENFGDTDDCDWSAGWFDEFPEDLTDVGGLVEADVRLFVD